jgi:hydrogenase maturation protein HypF
MRRSSAPDRVALAHLRAAGIAWDLDLPCAAVCPELERKLLERQIERQLNCVPTSSMGRLFDAVAALLGIRQTVTYEAQAAIEMEALCEGWDSPPELAFAFDQPDPGGPIAIDPAPLLRTLAQEIRRGVSPAQLAARFHRAVADLIVTLSRSARVRTGLATAALSGGFFQNVLLQRLAVDALRDEGFEVLIHRLVPPNDGGLALGQAAVAWARQSINSYP